MNINNYYTPIDEDPKNDLKNVLFPIYYLFDKDINDENGTYERCRTNIRRDYQLDKLFMLESSNIIDLSYGNHATLLYKFKINNDNYILYSNSGLGINNNINTIINGTKYLNHRLFKINKNLDICDYIKKFMDIIDLIDQKKHLGQSNVIESIKNDIEKISNHINMRIRIKIVSSIDKIVNDIYNNNKNCTYLIYALLILFCDSYRKEESYIEESYKEESYIEESYKKESYIEESYISKIIGYISNITNNKYNKDNLLDLFDLYIYCKNKEITYINYVHINNNHDHNFIILIKYINNEIDKSDKFSDETLKYTKNMFKIEYNNYGLLSIVQNSGSCTFYSYFNLGITILILNLYFNKKYNNEQKKDIYINNCIKFHSKMMSLLCDTNDYSYKNYNIQNLFFDNFIYKLLEENNLIDDLIKFYSKNNKLIFNIKKRKGIDNLLPHKIIIDNNINEYETILNCDYYIDLNASNLRFLYFI